MSNPTADFVTERKPSPQKPRGILKKSRPSATYSPPSASEPDTVSFGNVPLQKDGDDQDQEPITGLTRQQASRILQLAKSQPLKPAVPLEVFELLSSFPLSNPASPSDISTFLSHVVNFSPAEYLDLIEERNCLSKCGYTLCPNKRRSLPGEYKIHRGGVAKTADLNKWCSDDCALKGLHVKVQLDNPSYVRIGGEMVIRVELRESREEEEKKKKKRAAEAAKKKEEQKGQSDTLSKDPAKLNLDSTEEQRLAEEMEKLDLSEQKKARQIVGALAIERNLMSGSKLEVNIKEKEITQTAQPPSVGRPEDAHLMVEGYNSASKGKKPERDEDDESDSDDDPFPTVRLEVINMGRS